jgi:hypothetical protein
MNPTVKAAWLAALRSGEYEQGRGRLRVGDTYCCLGVLADLYYSGQWERSKKLKMWVAGGKAGYPPTDVREWADLDGHAIRKLAEMNDQGKATFKEIAAYIEREL